MEREHTDYRVLAPQVDFTLNSKQKNLLGYFMYRYAGYSKHRLENEDWFYIADRELMTETGIGSFSTLHTYITYFVANGVIEKLNGDRHHSNQYRFTEPYRNSNLDYRCSTNCSTKCSTNIIETQETNEKSVAPTVAQSVAPTEKTPQMTVFRANCSTDKDIDKEKENITKPTTIKRDSTPREVDTVGSSNGSIDIEMPEWLQDVPPTEPFELYEEPTDTVTGIGSNKGSLEVEKNDTFQGDESETDPDTNNNSKTADLGHFQAVGGTTTHNQPKTLPNGIKTTSTGATGNVNNLSLQDRKALQSELTRKWDNFILQVPNMRRDTSDTYFNRFMDKVRVYYTGDYIQRIASQWTDQYQGAANEGWNDTKAKAIVKHGVSSAWPDTSIAHAVKQRFGRVNREWLTAAIREAKDAIYNVPLKVNTDPNGLPF